MKRTFIMLALVAAIMCQGIAIAAPKDPNPGQANRAIVFEYIVDGAVGSVRAQLAAFRDMAESISIGDMFDMQMMMNHLSQLSEMSTSIVSATNTAVSSMARNIK